MSLVCLFAQYHPSGRIPAHTRHTLAALAGCGLGLHVACSGVTALDADDAAFLAGLGASGHPRPNRGLDFGAWQHLFAAGCAERADAVLLANDSVLGPYAPLGPVIAAMQARGLDAWGLVESDERVWHLQSWFVCLSARALGRPAIRRVMAQDFAAMGKQEIILHGELGLGVAIVAENLSRGSAWGPARGLRRLIPVNPSHFDWRGMLESGRVPFIKTELLRDNPADIAWLHAWPKVLARLPGPMPTLPPAPRRAAPLRRLLLNALLSRDHGAALRGLLRQPGRSTP